MGRTLGEAVGAFAQPEELANLSKIYFAEQNIRRTFGGHVSLDLTLIRTRGSAIAEEPRDAPRQLKYYGRFLTELLTRSSANPEEPCEHTVI